jgi:ornithine cyclodeaminase/alanine dehydrogenase-like protein (mu-crystallin family)
MLFLSGAEVRACLSCDTAMAAVEQALAIQESGAFSMPDRLNMDCGAQGNTLLLMPCRTQEALATKLVSVFPRNRDRGLPVIDGLVVLNDASSGQVLALMDGKAVTALRTAAVTGVSVRHLASPGAHTLGLVGCGAQAFDQVRHVCAARPIREVLLHSRTARSRDALVERLSAELPKVNVRAAASVESLMSECQVVVTATSAREPVLPDDPALFEEKHCVAIGSYEPTVREYPDAVFTRTARVWVDTPHALVESGELALPLAQGSLEVGQIETLGALIARGASPDRGEFGTTFFKSVGMALFDLKAARAIYDAARRRNLGTEFEF